MRTPYLFANIFGAGIKSFYSRLFIVLFSAMLLVSCGGGSDGDAPDDDNDDVVNSLDQCPGTASGATVDVQGCSSIQLDADQDGVDNTIDLCPETPSGQSVDQVGCSAAQLDIDGDGVLNTSDLCSDTPPGESVDANGCGSSQRDTDLDGVNDGDDFCPNTPPTEQANLRGCGDLTQSKFTETDGLVVIEMESTNYPDGWAFEEGEGSIGEGFIEWTGEDLFNAPGSGLITIPVVITNPGKYRFNWRNSIREGSSVTESNDSWLKIEADNFFGERQAGVIAGDSPVGHIVCPKGQSSDNACVGDAPEGSGSAGWFKVFRFGGTPGDWLWRAGTSDRDTHAIFATFDAAGTYNILVSGRSRAHGIDRLVLYRSGNDSGINITDAAAENTDNVESTRQ